ncbi:MAG TPA: molecular chaperone DnaJ [Oceanospirillales bacterium]|nr:molecular chaperone DnaJ [Oceanospirillales bacterium]
MIVVIFFSGTSTAAKGRSSQPEYQGSTSEKTNPVLNELEALKNNPNSEIRNEQGWMIIKNGHTHWSFAPETHEAYPAFAKREFVQRGGQVLMRMSVTCGASKSICDKFVEDFKQLNDEIRSQFK